MSKPETITITIERQALENLFGAGGYSASSRPLSQALAMNIVAHSAWLAELIDSSEDKSDESNNFFAKAQLDSAKELIEAVEYAEMGLRGEDGNGPGGAP